MLETPPSAEVSSQPARPPRRWAGLQTFRALGHRNYRLYFVGQLISLLGTWLQSTAMTWLAWTLTHQSIWPGMIMASQMLPTCLLGGLGGSLAGRWPRRRIVFIAQSVLLVLALLLAFLVLAGKIQPWHLLLIAAANGLVAAVDMPARLTFVYDMVGRDDLMNAVALNSLLFNMARVAGPALGALALPTIGAGLCFLVNGLSYFAVLAALAAMDPAQLHVMGRAESSRATLGDGFRFLAAQPGLRSLLLVVGSLALLGWPVLSLLPALTQHGVGGDEAGYAWLLSSLGAGALLAALVVATFATPSRARLLIGTGMALAAVAELGLSWAQIVWQAQLGCLVLGAGLILVFSTAQGVTQLSASDHNRGVIMGIWSMVMFGAPPLGHLLAGLSADRQGVPVTLVILGSTLAVAGLVLVPRLPRPGRK